MDNLEIVPIRAFQDNYFWLLRRGRAAAIVDPGDAQPVLDMLAREGLELQAILTTHHHDDHIGGHAAILARHPVPVYGPFDTRIPSVTQPVGEGDRVTLEGLGATFDVIEIPGHTRSHIGYAGEGAVFCGDTLFVAGCGRLFEGTPAQMHGSLGKLARLPDATRVYCAHEYTLSNLRFARAVEPGNVALADYERTAADLRERDVPTVPSTIGLEKAINPFLRCGEPEVAASAVRAAGAPLDGPVAVLGAIREWKNRF